VPSAEVTSASNALIAVSIAVFAPCEAAATAASTYCLTV
jgi:hypothetical protein